MISLVKVKQKIIKKLAIKYSVLQNVILIIIGYYFYSQGHKQIRKKHLSSPNRSWTYPASGLSESFELDSWLVKVSGQSTDILFKKHHL